MIPASQFILAVVLAAILGAIMFGATLGVLFLLFRTNLDRAEYALYERLNAAGIHVPTQDIALWTEGECKAASLFAQKFPRGDYTAVPGFLKPYVPAFPS